MAFTKAGGTCKEITAELLGAQAKVESINFNPDVIAGRRLSPAGAMGIAQFMPATWQTWGNGGNAFNPIDAIPAQSRFMCWLVQQVPGHSVNNALAAYNAGLGTVHKYGGVPPYSETVNYVATIIRLQSN